MMVMTDAAPAAPDTGGPGRLALALAASVIAHAALLAVLAPALQPRNWTAPPPPPPAIAVQAEAVAQQAARRVEAEAAPAAPAQASGSRPAPTAMPQRQRLTAAPPDARPLPATAPDAVRAAPAATPPAPPLRPPALPGAGLAALPVAGPAVQAAAILPAPIMPGVRPAGPRTAPAVPQAEPAPARPLPAERQTAAPAPPGSIGLPAEAIAAFLRPGDIRPGDGAVAELRDGLAAALDSLPCARIQSSFNPETGALDLRGHVPDAAMKPLVLDMLGRMLGPGLPVTGELLVLPRPQCQMLAAIDALGLPQSDEQFTNPRVIGPDAHVRDYRFAEGDRLVLDLTSPDYPAWLMVDYFDARGQVLHLAPNALVPAVPVPPATPLRVGDGALAITIAPPFGQEIAVALASSAPLHGPDRPLVEPAQPYLADLAERLRAARAADPGFRGEWVYFFVTTTPR